MPKIIRWNTPFTDKQYSAVEFLTTVEQNKYDVLQVLIAPLGIDKYPKYLIYFGQVLVFIYMEEANSPQMIFVGELKNNIEPFLSAFQ